MLRAEPQAKFPRDECAVNDKYFSKTVNTNTNNPNEIYTVDIFIIL